MLQDKTKPQTKLKTRISSRSRPTITSILFFVFPVLFLFQSLSFVTFYSSFHISAGMQRVHSSTILVLTALVLCIQGVSSQPDRDLNQNQDLEIDMRHHRLLQRAHGAELLSQVRT